MPKTSLDQLSINALRILAMDAVETAGAGDAGTAMALADLAYVLWLRHLHHNPRNPRWPNRDRFVLSAGHAAVLLYSLLHFTGYPLFLENLRQFRQWDSPTPGHPVYTPDLGIETTSGPPGQGFANAVGMAIARTHMTLHFNRPGYPLFDHRIYVIVSELELQEGITHEAASLAGHLGLKGLICCCNATGVTREGPLANATTEDVAARFTAYGWNVRTLDGHDFDALDGAILAARQAQDRPQLLICRTHLAYGSPNKQDSPLAEGQPLGAEEVRVTRLALGWPDETAFAIPEEVQAHYQVAMSQGEQQEARWRELLTGYAKEYPAEWQQLQRRLAGKLPPDLEHALPNFVPESGPLATRTAADKALHALMPRLPELFGGAAGPLMETAGALDHALAFQKATPEGQYLWFGGREHAMGGILNGIALHGGLRVWGKTRLLLSDYLRPSLRLTAQMRLPLILVFTHDSIFGSEEGPALAPVEQLAGLRALPGITVLRPADANEAAAAVLLALQQPQPVALILSRQPLPVIEETSRLAPEGVAHGAYILREAPQERIDLLLIASGSEVALALEAQRLLTERHISARVISMPSWELFEAQSLFYRLSVFPPGVVKRLAIEAGLPLGWERYVGPQGAVLGIQRFGASAPGAVLQEHFGFTAERILERAIRLLAE